MCYEEQQNKGLRNERKLISTAKFISTAKLISKISFLRQFLKSRAKKMISVHSLGTNRKNSNHSFYIKEM